ncbi:hypothetical protein K0M31_007265, partial [Melipona bicolor]
MHVSEFLSHDVVRTSRRLLSFSFRYVSITSTRSYVPWIFGEVFGESVARLEDFKISARGTFREIKSVKLPRSQFVGFLVRFLGESKSVKLQDCKISVCGIFGEILGESETGKLLDCMILKSRGILGESKSIKLQDSRGTFGEIKSVKLPRSQFVGFLERFLGESKSVKLQDRKISVCGIFGEVFGESETGKLQDCKILRSRGILGESKSVKLQDCKISVCGIFGEVFGESKTVKLQDCKILRSQLVGFLEKVRLENCKI